MARVIDAACELFAQHGIRACTLDHVGAASGIGRGQMYHYFTGKSDLVAAVVKVQVERTVGPAVEAIDRIATVEELQRVGADVALLYTGSERVTRCPLGSLVHEFGVDDDAARTVVAAGLMRWQAAWARTLRRLQESGTIGGHFDADATAAALLATYQGAIVLAAAYDDTGVIRTSLEGVIEPLTKRLDEVA